MHKEHAEKLLALVALPLLLLAGCAQQEIASNALAAGTASGELAAEATSADGLVPRESGLDSVSAAYAFDMSGAKVYLEPVTVEYRKRYPRVGSPLRARDYELDDRDLEKLQALMGEALSERFLAERNSELVANKNEADYVMQLDLSRFALGAPLDPSPWVWRVYTDQSAYGVLSGQLQDRAGNTVMRFSDRRDIGDNFGNLGPHGRFERFTSVTFWTDMKVDMRRAFSSLDASLR